MTTRIYVGIGTRATPGPVLADMTKMAARLARTGWYLATGGARGADAAGAPAGRRTLYLPLPGCNGLAGPDFHALSCSELAGCIDIAASVHTAWHRCSQAVRKLHARNASVILCEVRPHCESGTITNGHGKRTPCYTPARRVAVREPIWELADSGEGANILPSRRGAPGDSRMMRRIRFALEHRGTTTGEGEMIPKSRIPTFDDLLWPTLKALEGIGGSASIQELSSRIAMDMALPDEVLDILHKEGPQTEVDYRAAWARTHLRMIGAIDNTARGVWTISDRGRDVASEEQVRELVRTARADRFKAKKPTGAKAPEPDPADTDQDEDWEDALLGILRSMAPDAFERLCQRMLRESGFTRVEVTGRSGDGGIDGAGVLRVNLISFHVRFQCKRYAGSVGAREIRDFRGAMVGRADKGLFITTGAFTKEAQREAVRDGAPAIDLIDGSELCTLLKDLAIGVSTKTVQEITPEPEFFDAL